MTNWRDGGANALLEGYDESSDIKDLVDTFLRNDPGFEQSEVVTFINNALTNDAREISFHRDEVAEMTSTMSSFAEMNRANGDVPRAEGYEAEAEAMQSRADAEFTSRRDALGAVVRDLATEKGLPITGETREALTALDGDGQMTQAVGFALSPGSGFEPPAPAVSAAPQNHGRREADFSRERGQDFSAEQQRRAAVKARQYQQQQSKNDELAREAAERTEREDRSPVLVGEVVRKWRLSQGRDADGNTIEMQDSKDDSPGMG